VSLGGAFFSSLANAFKFPYLHRILYEGAKKPTVATVLVHCHASRRSGPRIGLHNHDSLPLLSPAALVIWRLCSAGSSTLTVSLK